MLMARGSCSLYVVVVCFYVPLLQCCRAKLSFWTAYAQELEDQIIEDLSQDYVQGLTLLGGEPFLNTDVCLQLCRRIRKEFGHSKDIWSWTGYTWEELEQETYDKMRLLSLLDILVDGRFLEEEKDLTLQFRGSANQRIIDVPKCWHKMKLSFGIS